MKKTGKKLSAILFVALCCVLLFPITAMAEEIIEEPIALPETMTITKQLFSDSGELEPEKITIKSHEDGQFSFEYPANTVSDMRGYGDNHSIKKVAETAGKLGEVGFEKNVTGTVGDNLNGENK